MGFPWAIFQKKEERLNVSSFVCFADGFSILFWTLLDSIVPAPIEKWLSKKGGHSHTVLQMHAQRVCYGKKNKKEESVIYANSVERDE